MIVDWNGHINECVRQTKVIIPFHSMPCEKHTLRLFIIKKLLEKGYNLNQIKNWFIIADEESFAEECCNPEMLAYYVEKAMAMHYFRSHDFRIFVTMKEIETIEALKESKECKSFLLGIICFAKMMIIKRGLPTMNTMERSYAYYIGNGGDYYFNRKRYEVMEPFLRRLYKQKKFGTKNKVSHIKKYTGHWGGSVKDVNNTILTDMDWVTFRATEGYEITNLETQVKELADRVFTNGVKKVCSVCGQEFEISSKSKTDKCPTCYKAFRAQYNKSLDCRKNHSENDKRVGHHGKKLGGEQENSVIHIVKEERAKTQS